MSIDIWGSKLANCYIGSKAVKEIYLGGEKVRPTSSGYVYDFTNSSLNWSVSNSSKISRASGKGRWYTNWWDHSELLIPPSSTYDWNTLKKIVITTKALSSRTGIWVNISNTQATTWCIRYRNVDANYIWFWDLSSSNNVDVWAHNGEVEIEINFEANKVYGSVGGTSYSINSSYGQKFLDAWTNKTLSFHMGTWLSSGSTTIYISKIEIYTAA